MKSSNVTAEEAYRQEASWTTEELEALTPPQPLTVSQWADKYRVLISRYSALPGPWRTSRFPYTREPMDIFRGRWLERLTLCFATQTAKTEILLNLVGYVMDQDPGPGLVAYPTDTLAKVFGKGRLRSMIDTCEPLSEKYDRDLSEIQEHYFNGAYLAIVGGGSPSQLASRPARYVFFDETEKFDLYAGNDANPFELAGERTKTFLNKKEVAVSSPKDPDGYIWQSLLKADIIKRYFVPCPHCGAMWTLKFPQIKWPADLNEPERKHERTERVLFESWYECECCGERIYDMDKFAMLEAGEWRPVEVTKEGKWLERDPATVPQRPRHVAYNLSSIYSPRVSFGQVAQKFLQCRGYPEKEMNFINGWLGEPHEARAVKLRSDRVLEMQATHKRGEVPPEAQLLVAGIDVQLDHFWWVVRAWGSNLTSWLVDFGQCETWTELDEVLDREYPTPGGNPMLVYLAFIDSGDRTDEVYEYCTTRPGLVVPCKGSSQRMPRAPSMESQVEKSGFGELKLFIVDGHYYKNAISGRLERAPGSPGSFMVFRDEDAREGEGGWLRQYADQLCSEKLVTEVDKKGRKREVWQPLVTHIANHLLDAEVYAFAAAERAGVRYLKDTEEESTE